MRARRRCAAIGITWLLALAWHVSGERLPITYFTVSEGLSHNRIGRIVQDSHGFVWFCSPRGLSRFDGQTFVNYGAQEGLPHEPVNDLLEVDGTYWIATNGGGVVRFDSDAADRRDGATPFRATRFPVGASAATNRVNVIYRDASGALWAGSDAGLFRRAPTSADSNFEPIPLQLASHPDHTTQVWALLEDDAKNLWIGSRFGLLRRAPDGRIAQYSIQPDANTDHVWTLLFVDGRLWFGHNSGLIVFKPPAEARSTTLDLRAPERGEDGLQPPDLPGDARRYSAGEGLPAEPVRAVVESSAGSLWIGTAGGGLAELRAGRLHTCTREHGLNDMFVAAVLEDRGGNTWVGTRNGALRLARRGFVTYGESDGLGPVVGHVFERDGVLYATSQEFLISRFDGMRFVSVRLRVPPGVSGWRTQSIMADRSGEVWLATRDGVFRYPRVERFEQLAHLSPHATYTARDGLADNDVNNLFEDSRGDVWMSHFAPGQDVLTRWERSTNTLHRYSSAHGLRPFSPASVFGESATGEVWIGFRNGEVVRYSGGRFIQEIPPAPQPERRVNAIHDDGSGKIWIGILGTGLVRIDTGQQGASRIRTYTVAGVDNFGYSAQAYTIEVEIE